MPGLVLILALAALFLAASRRDWVVGAGAGSGAVVAAVALQAAASLAPASAPRLTDAVAQAEFDGEGSYEVTETGAADAVREVGRTTKRTARRGAGQAKRTARQARKVPGVARAEGTVKGAVASESDLAIPNYDALSADEIQDRLSELSQIDLAKVDAYERKNQNRATVTSRIDALKGDEPWPGYDELSVDEVRAVLSEGDEQRVKDVRAYERKHKARAGVIEATERELSNA